MNGGSPTFSYVAAPQSPRLATLSAKAVKGGSPNHSHGDEGKYSFEDVNRSAAGDSTSLNDSDDEFTLDHDESHQPFETLSENDKDLEIPKVPKAEKAAKSVTFIDEVPPERVKAHGRHPTKSILKRAETYDECLNRVLREREMGGRYLDSMVQGSLLTKCGTRGKRCSRWFFVAPDGSELYWSTERKDKAAKKSVFGKLFRPRRRPLADVVAVHYGSASPGFQRWQATDSSFRSWLCLTLEFTDRTIDLVCANEKEVTMWFLGLQALCPLSSYYLTFGALLWQRLIMKLNFFGFDPIRGPMPTPPPSRTGTPQSGTPHSGTPQSQTPRSSMIKARRDSLSKMNRTVEVGLGVLPERPLNDNDSDAGSADGACDVIGDALLREGNGEGSDEGEDDEVTVIHGFNGLV